MSNAILSIREHIAKGDYVCHGCGGEAEKLHHIPIKRGYIYFAAAVPIAGTVKTLRYCPRCYYAIKSKMRHSADCTIDLTGGSLQWQRLSSAFRRQFAEYMAILVKWRDEKDEKKKELYNQMRKRMEEEFEKTEAEK